MKKVYLVRFLTEWDEEIEEGYFTTEEEANKCANAINEYLGSLDKAEAIEVFPINVQEEFDLDAFKEQYNIE